MPSEDDPGKIAAVAEAVSTALEKVPVYQDALQPPAKEAGKLAAAPLQIVNTALRPILSLARATDQVFDLLDREVSKLLASTPPEKIVAPPPQLAGPLLSAYRFVQEDHELRKAFEQLLATSMHADQRANVHPSFAEILRQITGVEAVILGLFATAGSRNPPSLRLEMHLPEDQYVEFGVLLPFTAELSARTGVGPRAVGAYLDNLDRLGILRSRDPGLIKSALYERFKEMPFIEEAKSVAASRGFTLETNRESMMVTDFGMRFTRAVTGLATPP